MVEHRAENAGVPGSNPGGTITFERSNNHDWNPNKKLKEIRFRPRIAENDLKMRLNQAKGFLKKKLQVRVTVLFWGKFRRKKDAKKDKIFQEAEEKLERFAKLGKMVSPPRMTGSKYTMVIEQ